MRQRTFISHVGRVAFAAFSGGNMMQSTTELCPSESMKSGNEQGLRQFMFKHSGLHLALSLSELSFSSVRRI
jgi:hypothetical protein